MLSTLELDAQTIARIPHSQIKNEPQLYDSKWWDYRFLHPMQATEAFARCYIQAIKRGVLQRYDLEASRHISVFKTGVFLDEPKTTITGLWKARRMADLHGIRYDSYCRYAVNYALLCNWTYLPKPSQLYSKKKPENGPYSLVSYVIECWSKTSELAADEMYKPAGYNGHPYQRKYLKSILDRIGKSRMKPGAVATYVYEKRLILPEMLIAYFGEEAKFWLEEAKLYTNEEV